MSEISPQILLFSKIVFLAWKDTKNRFALKMFTPMVVAKETELIALINNVYQPLKEDLKIVFPNEKPYNAVFIPTHKRRNGEKWWIPIFSKKVLVKNMALENHVSWINMGQKLLCHYCSLFRVLRIVGICLFHLRAKDSDAYQKYSE